MKLSLAFLALIVVMTIATITEANEHRIDVCHISGYPVYKATGETKLVSVSEHTIQIDKHALPAHLAHGDKEGACLPNIKPISKVTSYRTIRGQ